MDKEEIARWAFIAFVAIAIIMGLVVGYMGYSGDANYANTNAYVMLVLLIIGIIVGFISITTEEVMPFLVATIALVVSASADVWSPLDLIHPLLYHWAWSILSFIVAFAAPAAVINAIRAVFAKAKAK